MNGQRGGPCLWFKGLESSASLKAVIYQAPVWLLLGYPHPHVVTPPSRHSEPFFGSALPRRDILFSVPVVSELKTTGRVHSPLAFCPGPEKDVAPVLVTLDITQEDGGVAARALSLSSCLGRTDSLPEPCSVPHRPAPQPLAWVNPWPVQPALPFARS